MSNNIERYNKIRNGGLLIQSNFTTIDAVNEAVKSGRTNPEILYIGSYEDQYDFSPAYHDCYTLEQTKELRDYLNNLIAIAENALALCQPVNS